MCCAGAVVVPHCQTCLHSNSRGVPCIRMRCACCTCRFCGALVLSVQHWLSCSLLPCALVLTMHHAMCYPAPTDALQPLVRPLNVRFSNIQHLDLSEYEASHFHGEQLHEVISTLLAMRTPWSSIKHLRLHASMDAISAALMAATCPNVQAITVVGARYEGWPPLVIQNMVSRLPLLQELEISNADMYEGRFMTLLCLDGLRALATYSSRLTSLSIGIDERCCDLDALWRLTHLTNLWLRISNEESPDTMLHGMSSLRNMQSLHIEAYSRNYQILDAWPDHAFGVAKGLSALTAIRSLHVPSIPGGSGFHINMPTLTLWHLDASTFCTLVNCFTQLQELSTWSMDLAGCAEVPFCHASLTKLTIGCACMYYPEGSKLVHAMPALQSLDILSTSSYIPACVLDGMTQLKCISGCKMESEEDLRALAAMPHLAKLVAFFSTSGSLELAALTQLVDLTCQFAWAVCSPITFAACCHSIGQLPRLQVVAPKVPHLPTGTFTNEQVEAAANAACASLSHAPALQELLWCGIDAYSFAPRAKDTAHPSDQLVLNDQRVSMLAGSNTIRKINIMGEPLVSEERCAVLARHCNVGFPFYHTAFSERYWVNQ